MSRTANFVVKQMKRAFPEISGVEARSETKIFLGDVGEGGTINGIVACSYYNEDYKEQIFVMGVHKELRNFMEDHGWFVECHDAGTYFAYQI